MPKILPDPPHIFSRIGAIEPIIDDIGVDCGKRYRLQDGTVFETPKGYQAVVGSVNGLLLLNFENYASEGLVWVHNLDRDRVSAISILRLENRISSPALKSLFDFVPTEAQAQELGDTTTGSSIELQDRMPNDRWLGRLTGPLLAGHRGIVTSVLRDPINELVWLHILFPDQVEATRRYAALRPSQVRLKGSPSSLSTAA